MQIRTGDLSWVARGGTVLLFVWCFVRFGGSAGAQVIETESTRLLKRGFWGIGANIEYQTSSDGDETALPLLIEYGITDRLELAFEPTAYARIHPKGSKSATGFGDTEATLTYRFFEETHDWPAFAAAAEVKFPTAKNDLIGSGETDYTAYLIASKRFGALDVHANLSYTLTGDPAGVNLDNVYGFGLAGVYRINQDWEVFGEVLGNTSAQGGSSESSVTPEASTGELVGTLGIGRFFENGLLLHAAISEDNNQATQLRIGFTFGF